MIKCVYLDAKFDKQVRTVSRAGKKGALAADKVKSIIDALVDGETDDFGRLGSLTKHGEARIDKCVKYDLGAGYRAVCAWDKESFYVLFVGSHDECDRWIETNRGLSLDQDLSIGRALKVRQNFPSSACSESQPEPDEEDHFYPESIDQQTLRKVFCGLCGQSA
ncbi:hypothetical protein [Desulfatibacillum aliphaticivorans]|uniref:hypothetical protein n=1 Tax=Desulfatibacillum aliphaticivorans TaxID=218208 RepID=UPI0004176D32|nr:hypothetical protein [Desulfatibacillum aliphaticivorans]